MSFFLIFFGIYLIFHLYFFGKIRKAYNWARPGTVVTFVWMAAMVPGPALVRYFEHIGLEPLAMGYAMVSYLWMGFLFLFVVIALGLDIVRLAIFVGSCFWKTAGPAAHITSMGQFLIPAGLALAIAIYGYGEALAIRTERITVISAKVGPRSVAPAPSLAPATLPPSGRSDAPAPSPVSATLPSSGRSLRIVQISDVHLGLIVGRERLRRIAAIVRDLNPDILVATGDIVDGQIDGLAGCADLLAGLAPPFGKYAVIGNHEYYAGIEQSLAFLERAGFTVLRDQAVALPDAGITLVGIEDRHSRQSTADDNEHEVLAGAMGPLFTLVLKHRPVVASNNRGLFDLQLSGHVHQGQIFPFGYLTRLVFPVPTGQLVPVPGGGSLYVSRGTGTWGPPIRFLAPPEITVFDITPP